jgi:hypothetical protein
MIYHRLETIVHGLWLLSFVEDEPSKLSLHHLPFGDLGDFITFCAVLSTSQISFALFNPCTMVYSLHKEASSMVVP